ncbi:MAG: alpha/beta fold hydrolase [Deltaproteobacteria bacterium]|nr:alpha/beta fold hydrolase [Deltaproteobacteria bacterium]
MPFEMINDVSLHYEEAGEGEAILFLHGYTGSTKDWAYQAALLSSQYRVIALDHRGHGMSSGPHEEEGYSIPISSNDVYELLRLLDVDRCCLVGHSMGGFISLQFALDHPDLVSALVLVDTSSGTFDVAPGYPAMRAKMDELAREEGVEAAFEYEAAHNPLRIERYRRHPEWREVARRKALGTSVDGYIYVARSFGKWQPVTNRLGEIRVPTLIFRGEEDAPFATASETLKASITGSDLVIVPGAGHSPHEENLDIFNEKLTAFLASVYRI